MINSFFSSRLFFGMVFIIAFLGLFGYFKQENAALRSQIRYLESDVSSLKSDVSSLESDVSSLESDLFNSSSEVDEYDFRRLKNKVEWDLERKVEDLESEVEKLKRKVSDLEYKVR